MDATTYPARPASVEPEHQPREHACACITCRRPTWEHDAICAPCKNRVA